MLISNPVAGTSEFVNLYLDILGDVLPRAQRVKAIFTECDFNLIKILYLIKKMRAVDKRIKMIFTNGVLVKIILIFFKDVSMKHV